MSRRIKLSNEINAGSIADIAFLLLIFFLVTTTISEDKGVLVKLPPYLPDPPSPQAFNERNVFSVFLNSKNELLVRGQDISIDLLKEKAKQFIINPHQDTKMAESPKKAIISLKNDRGTNYGSYLEVYNELKTAYAELWEEMAMDKYQKKLDELHPSVSKSIRNAIPLVISESETTAFGVEN